ncbi:MAG: DUF4446 family protein [Candidatus Paceibacterota bacterium]|jgi:hypothetical protein|nr:DUF4446 family protein [bacterium]
MFFGKSKEKKVIKTIEDAINCIENLEKKLDSSNERIKELENNSKFFFEKFELIRYNPFSEVGGDQSFSLVLLNNKNDGFVFTSIYTKEGNRLYAKPISKGESKYQLSDEEKNIVKKLANKK